MKIFFAVLPIALLVAISQIVVKWRATSLGLDRALDMGAAQKIWLYLQDPYLLGSYLIALVASFAWLLIVARLPLTVAFPVYIGTTFLLVLVAGWLFLGEPLSVTRLAASALILMGIALGVRS